MSKYEFNTSKCKHCGKLIIKQYSDRFATYLWTHIGSDFNCQTTQAEPE